MDDLNPQLQNPNIDSGSKTNSPLVTIKDHKKKIVIFGILVAIAGLVILGLVWKYAREMKNSVDMMVPISSPAPLLSVEVQEDNQVNQELQNLDLGDLDSEFESIDADLNNL